MATAEVFKEYAKFYELPEGSDISEITADLLESPFVKDREKESIRKFQRRVFVFAYPSDGLKVKGLISFVPQPENHPLMVFLRGGNRGFGVLNPGSDLIVHRETTVIATLYRGGISEGVDEFGGEDVNDVKHLVDYIPDLEMKLGIKVSHHKMFLLGGSRGGMQMFLALSRFPELQSKVSKAVSLSGLLDMRERVATRKDMEEMFVRDFGLQGLDDVEWIDKRDPMLAVEKIRHDLPLLIIQGTNDERTHLQMGYNLIEKRKALGGQIAYWEIEGGTHCLGNNTDRMEKISDWFESI